MAQYVVAALYKFTDFPDFRQWQEPLRQLMENRGIKGTLLLAHEGINGTVAGTRDAIDELVDLLRQDDRFNGWEYKESMADEQPFNRVRVRLKKEIVTMGVSDIRPTCTVGQYVAPEDWNALISDPDVVVIDTRNDYEYAIGTFRGAINPKTDTFGEFPSYVDRTLDPGRHRKVAMFCTGGIRCEKATSYLKQQGFEQVFHLQGGILNYLERIPAEHSLWDGECFVFDQRVSVTHGVQPGSYDLCHACRLPISPTDKAAPEFIQGIQCPHCAGRLPEKTRARATERQRQTRLQAERERSRPGSDNS